MNIETIRSLMNVHVQEMGFEDWDDYIYHNLDLYEGSVKAKVLKSLVVSLMLLVSDVNKLLDNEEGSN